MLTNANVKEDNNDWIEFTINRMVERIHKYESRGFKAQSYETCVILPWMIHRFKYADFERERNNEVSELKELVRKLILQQQILVLDKISKLQL